MNKAVVYAGIGLGTAAVGYLLYKYAFTPTGQYLTTSLNPNSNQKTENFTTDHHQTYPIVTNIPPRVDSSNQPWANNNRAAIAQVSNPQINVNLKNIQDLANYTRAGSEIVNSVQSIWDDLGVKNWFNKEDPTGLVTETSDAVWETE